MDPAADAIFQESVRRLTGCTVLCIAHRLDTILGTDRVLVLEAGLLVEYGPPRELQKVLLSCTSNQTLHGHGVCIAMMRAALHGASLSCFESDQLNLQAFIRPEVGAWKLISAIVSHLCCMQDPKGAFSRLLAHARQSSQ